jgi:hypothetical protein
MKTAVEWLIEKHFGSIENCSPNFRNHIEQAKAMEKEQIKISWVSAWQDSMVNPLEYKYYEPEAEQYYNKTYKSE